MNIGSVFLFFLAPIVPLMLVWLFVWLTARDKQRDNRLAASSPGLSGKWYVTFGNKEHGPFGLPQLCRFRDNGLITPQSSVRAGQESIEARHIPGLFPEPMVEFAEQPVEFQTFGGHADPGKLGKGTVRIVNGELILHGRRRRLFALRKHDENIALRNLCDVAQDGRLLRFRVDGQAANRPRLLKMASRETVQALAKHLPERMSNELAQAVADRQVFSNFLHKTGKPYVTLAVIAANLAIFVYVAAKGGGWFKGDAAVLIEFGGNIAPATTQGEWWRLLTAIFLHSGLVHVVFNMWALWEAGRIAERLFGRISYLTLYLASGLLGSVASINWQQDRVSIGASGAVFGIYGALTTALYLRKELLPKTIADRLRIAGTIFIAYSLFNGFTHAGVDNAAHLGGLFCGTLLGAGLVALSKPRLWGAYTLAAGLMGAGMAHAASLVEPIRDEMTFKRFIAGFGAEERRLNESMLRLFREGKSLPVTEFAHRLDKEIIDGWRAQEARINNIEHVSPKTRAFRDTMADFIGTKRDALEDLRDGVTRNDPLLVLASTLKTRWGNELIAETQRNAKKQADKKHSKDTGNSGS